MNDPEQDFATRIRTPGPPLARRVMTVLEQMVKTRLGAWVVGVGIWLILGLLNGVLWARRLTRRG